MMFKFGWRARYQRADRVVNPTTYAVKPLEINVIEGDDQFAGVSKMRRAKAKRVNRAAKVKISKPIAWIRKYIERVERTMPAMVMPRVIRSFMPHPKKEHRTLGSCIISERTITLASHSTAERTVNGRKKRVSVPLSKLEILQTLAHELSHLAYEHHGYEQEWYGRTIFNTFGLREPCPHCEGKGKIPARYENE